MTGTFVTGGSGFIDGRLIERLHADGYDVRALARSSAAAANRDGFETIVVRPRFVWGRGDTTLLPVMVEMVRSGRFAWIDGGRHRTSTTHVENTVEGLVLSATRGRGRGQHPALASAGETAWRLATLPGRPPLTRFAY